MGRPDFLIIGAMKCATSTLHDQLSEQPGIFMSTPKEPNFFSDDRRYAWGLEAYEALFDAAPEGALRGESSTHYTKRPTHSRAAQRIHRHLPEARLIYVMRHPVDRLVSHYMHDWTENRMSNGVDAAVESFPELIDYGRYAMQLAPYLALFGPERVLPVFFERLVSDPQDELERICRFIGYAGRPVWRERPPSNVSSQRMRGSALRDTLLKVPGLRAAVHSKLSPETRERLKALWRIDSRPRISDETRTRVIAAFDADLERLGRWLGAPLDCASFKRVVSERPLDWSPALVRRAS